MTATSSAERPGPSGGGTTLSPLDALRGIAILAVFAQHLGDRFEPLVRDAIESRAPAWLAPWLLTVFHHAWWGVDLFFVLSGFSLGLGFVRAKLRGGEMPSNADYFRRRARRILPGYVVAIAITLATHPNVFTRPAIGASLGVHALLLQGYLAPGGILLIGATWSLTTESQFYVLLPWLSKWLLDPHRVRRAAWFCVLLCVAVWVSRGILHSVAVEMGRRTDLFELTQRRLVTSRLDQFALGALGALLFETASPSQRAVARRFAPLGAIASAVVLVLAFRLEGALYLEALGSWPYALMSLATFTLVLSFTATDAGWAAPRPLCAIGVVSYGVFLYHQGLLGLAGHLVSPLPLAPTWTELAWVVAIALPASLLAGAASWRWIELPALRRGSASAVLPRA